MSASAGTLAADVGATDLADASALARQARRSASLPIGRQPELDWLRVGLFAGLIFYHEGLIYAPWSGWFAKSVHRQAGLESVLLLTHPWRMSLLFLISGVATRHMADRRAPGALCVSRSKRLLPPLIFAFVALVPIQGYLTFSEVPAFTASVGEFLHSYFSPAHTLTVGAVRYKLPVYGHLWFVLYVWAYTLILGVGLVLAPRAPGGLQKRLERALSGPGLLLWPMIILAGLRLTAYPAFGVTLGFLDDWYNHLVCGGLFVLGFCLGRSEGFWGAAVALRWHALGAAVLGYGVYAVAAAHYGGMPERVELAHPPIGVFYDIERWGAIVALLGFSRRHLTRPNGWVTYLNGGIFTYYLIHQPAMILALHWLKPAGLDIATEAVAIAAVTVATCAIVYEVARRLPLLAIALGCAPSARPVRST